MSIFGEWLAFLIPAIVPSKSAVDAFAAKIDPVHQVAAAEELPSFEREPWMAPTELDARPVMWSLLHRPDEWEITRNHITNDGTPYTITHKPSKHEFWTANGPGHYALHSAECGCTHLTNKFPERQQQAFHDALMRSPLMARSRETRQQQLAEQHRKFASHFIR